MTADGRHQFISCSSLYSCPAQEINRSEKYRILHETATKEKIRITSPMLENEQQELNTSNT